ncbi:MAG: MGMT family protein [Candidatus Doudnabacteria bacterium]|jgi:methylated-DNA-protein-cysteine methyltransferase-like protein
MTDFKQRVLKFIQSIPKGKVVSYGQVAANAGSPRSARQVGAILRNLELSFSGRIDSDLKTPRKGRFRKGKPFSGFLSEFVPWWRVINNQGVISIKGNWTAGKELQKQLLEKEGIKVGTNYKLDINKYRWLASL